MDAEKLTRLAALEQRFICTVRVGNEMVRGVDMLSMSKQLPSEQFREYVGLCRVQRAIRPTKA